MQLDVSRGVRAARPRLPALPRAGRGTAQSSTSVVTRMAFPAPPEQVWNALMLFESTEERPPLHLRLLLPIPVRTEGTTSQVGDEIRCRYRSGYLVKRITCIEASRHYEYEVIEQNLRVFSGLALAGGCYTLQPLLGDHTDVSVTTRYASILRPAWLWKRIEAMTFRMFHRPSLFCDATQGRCPALNRSPLGAASSGGVCDGKRPNGNAAGASLLPNECRRPLQHF